MEAEAKFIIWGGVLERQRRCQEALCILECLLCRGGPLQRFGPLPSGDQLKGATLVRSWAENGITNLPCRENVAAVWIVLQNVKLQNH